MNLLYFRSMTGEYVKRRTSLFFAVCLGCMGLAAQESLRPQVREKSSTPLSRENFHIYLLIGQSNMAGRGVVEPQDTMPDRRILRLNRAGDWETAKDPLHFDKPAAGTGPGLTFAREMLREAESDVSIGLVPCAVGGSGIDVWQAGAFFEQTGSYPYDDMLLRTKLALKDGVLKGILWHQGENDSETPTRIDTYKDKFVRFVATLRHDLHAGRVPFLAGELAPFSAHKPGIAAITQIFHDAVEEIAQYDVVSSSGLMPMPDGIHFDAASERELGRRYAEKMKILQGRKSGLICRHDDARREQLMLRNACDGRTPIDRKALVERHTVTLDSLSSSELLQVGNGEIAFGIDATGLQTFCGNTMSQWGWHSVPCPVEGKHDALRLQDYDFHGRTLSYRSSAQGQEELYRWMRENPHRICLGRLRFLIRNNKGQLIEPGDVKNIRQTLDMWNGVIESRYTVDGVSVHVITCVEPATGSLAVKVNTPLLQQGRLLVEWTFPYGHPGHTGADWTTPERHQTLLLSNSSNRTDLQRRMDDTRYHAAMSWDGKARFEETATHRFILTPDSKAETLTFSVQYADAKASDAPPSFDRAMQASGSHWQRFWKTGGAIDLSGSHDPRWMELERRIVLSQYLLAVNEAGSLPPQESGLFNNSGWYGKFHLEMHWWHGAHYALWNRWHLMNKSLKWYRDLLPQARKLARSQGFAGARWPKMTGPDAEDSPSGTGPLLIWQQPHPIFYAELEYRLSPTNETLDKWRATVQESAEFMATFAVFDTTAQHYVLGPPLATVSENSNYRISRNPTFELSYWRTGLRWAQTWRERLGLSRNPHWDEIIAHLAPLPVRDGVYLSQENMFDTYTEMNWEHPSLTGPGGMLPGDGTDAETRKRTVHKVWETWQWDRCWGWDFPMMAMAAARNGETRIAVNALLHPSCKNTYNQVGLSTGGPFPYFPSNGGLLYAVAMMAAGWDGAPNTHAPGFPDDGSWTVRFEDLSCAP
ncbi:MAG: sialate O-acetylesterase [Tannerella sp.]|nr:sialate O-acetylesterase [Tannerella sp.]